MMFDALMHYHYYFLCNKMQKYFVRVVHSQSQLKPPRPLVLYFFRVALQLAGPSLSIRVILFCSQVNAEQLLQLLNPVAEVKYIRMTGRESDVVKTALVEFTEQPGLHRVFGLNGTLLNNRPIM